MINRLTLRNFKGIEHRSYDFTRFDLLVGRNNSGKSTVLQALAIWQYCIDEFHLIKRTGKTGVQIILPNFTALPLPEFNLLWRNRTDRQWPMVNGRKSKQEYIYIRIEVEWRHSNGNNYVFGIDLRYHSAQTIYAIPNQGWAQFAELDVLGVLPRIAYVPPFSGLEPVEKWIDQGNIREQVGKAQPGSVLRNLLLKVCPSPPRDSLGRVLKDHSPPAEWAELQKVIERWFSVRLLEPEYRQGVDTRITVEYRQGDKRFDVISGGSGFHQTLTLLAFLFGYKPDTILLDEPDAHMHVNLQREVLDYFKRKSAETGIQFLIATHAEELAKGVDAAQIMSLPPNGAPVRVKSTPAVLRAMADVTNDEITRLLASPRILYVEGATDERILRAWAEACGARDVLDKVVFKAMNGGGKKAMADAADAHFLALRQVIPGVRRLMILDFDDASTYHPDPESDTQVEWRRKNIENYLLVPESWSRAAMAAMGSSSGDLFTCIASDQIKEFFTSENLLLPPGKSWRNVSASIFAAVDGKKLLFENDDSLFHRLQGGASPVLLTRESVAAAMNPDEIHEDVFKVFDKLKAMVLADDVDGGS